MSAKHNMCLLLAVASVMATAEVSMFADTSPATTPDTPSSHVAPSTPVLPEQIIESCRSICEGPQMPDRSSVRRLMQALERWERRYAQTPHAQTRVWIGKLALIQRDPDRVLAAVDPVIANASITGHFASQENEAVWLQGWAQLLKAQSDLAPPGLPSAYRLSILGDNGAELFMDVTPDPTLTPKQVHWAKSAAASFEILAMEAGADQRVLAYDGLGYAQILLGEYNEADSAFGRAITYARIAPNPSSSSTDQQSLMARLHLAQGQARLLADLKTYGQGLIAFREANRLQQEGQYDAAIRLYRRCIDLSSHDPKTPEDDAAPSPLISAAGLNGARCMVRMDQPVQAYRTLDAMIESEVAGVYTGEVYLMRAELLLDPRIGRPSALKAIQDLDRFDTWIEQARTDPLRARVGYLPTGLTHDPTSSDATADTVSQANTWSQTRLKSPIPGSLIHYRNTPGYLDGLEARSAMLRGFLHLANADGQAALEQFKRLLKLDPTNQDIAILRGPSDFARLKFACEQGYLVALPQELWSFSDIQRLGVLQGDFLYVTRRFEDAHRIYQNLLHDRYGKLNKEARDYATYGTAMCQARTGNREQALETLESVIERTDHTLTEQRASIALANLSRAASDDDRTNQSDSLLQRLAYSDNRSRWADQARISMAIDYYAIGSRGAAQNMLRRVQAREGPLNRLARILFASENVF